jgi:hypothetical protein
MLNRELALLTSNWWHLPLTHWLFPLFLNDRPHRKHHFQHFLNCCVESLFCFCDTWFYSVADKQTDSTDHNCWEADSSHSATQDIPCLFWNVRTHYYALKSLSLVPILSHPHQFFKTHFVCINIFQEISFLHFFRKNLYTFLICLMHATCLPISCFLVSWS